MKIRILVLAASLAVMLAQTQPSQPSQPSQDAQKTQANTDKTSTSSARANTMPAEMKTMTYKGVLVDMSCGSHSSAATAGTPASTAATATAESDKASSANRSASDSGSSCPVTANSTELGMKLDDGHTVRFDLVGNQRAQDELKNNKSWNKDITASKPLRVKVIGVMSGDKLVVSSIH
jgi:hypothetical protein